MVSSVVAHTNTYALLKIETTSYSGCYLDKDGFWPRTSDKEIEAYMALLIYFRLVKVGAWGPFAILEHQNHLTWFVSQKDDLQSL